MSENTEFSWSHKEAIVVEAVEAIAVYQNPDGHVVIRQQDTTGQRDGDSFVIVPIDRIPALITALQKEIAS